MNKLMISLFLLCLLFGGNVYAWDYIPYQTQWVHKDPLSVCLFRPKYDFSAANYTAIKAGISEWSNKLNSKTHSSNWNIPVKELTEGQYANCNVLVVINTEKVKPTINNATGKNMTITAASTDCIWLPNDVNHNHLYCAILMNAQVLNAYEAKYHFGTGWQNVFEHEFGHVLGLGHRYADNMFDYIHAIDSRDIMLAVNDPNIPHKITDGDLEAILNAWGPWGFVNPHEVFPGNEYQIWTHPTSSTKPY